MRGWYLSLTNCSGLYTLHNHRQGSIYSHLRLVLGSHSYVSIYTAYEYKAFSEN